MSRRIVGLISILLGVSSILVLLFGNNFRETVHYDFGTFMPFAILFSSYLLFSFITKITMLLQKSYEMINLAALIFWSATFIYAVTFDQGSTGIDYPWYHDVSTAILCLGLSAVDLLDFLRIHPDYI